MLEQEDMFMKLVWKIYQLELEIDRVEKKLRRTEIKDSKAC
jgi:hypothetical protein